MNNKFTISDERFDIKPIPLYKRATGVSQVLDDDIKPAEIKKVESPKNLESKNAKKNPKSHRMTQSTIRIENRQLLELRLIHARTGSNVSMLISNAITEYIKQNHFAVLHVPLDVIVPKVLQIDKQLLKQLKLYALEHGVFQSDVVRNALDVFIAKNNAK